MDLADTNSIPWGWQKVYVHDVILLKPRHFGSLSF